MQLFLLLLSLDRNENVSQSQLNTSFNFRIVSSADYSTRISSLFVVVVSHCNELIEMMMDEITKGRDVYFSLTELYSFPEFHSRI